MSSPLVRRRLPLVALLLDAGLMAPTVSAEDSPRRLRVLSYNIHHGEGVDGDVFRLR